jgi:phenylpropionate dioxygenase-like ring-hydroxylating dioxygenase large terminal subunit
MRKLLMVALAVMGISACSDGTAAKDKAAVDKFVAFALTEVDWLQKMQPGLRKTVTKGEEVSTESMDTLDWSNELEWVTEWSLTEATKKSKYDETVDSSGTLKIVRFNAQDTAAELQEFMVNYRKEKIQLMQWTIKQRSWYMDRDVRISFQPRQGYGVSVNENAIWASPNSYEIFAEIGRN